MNVVDPAMESALNIIQKFVSDAKNGKIPDTRFSFGTPWRHPPCTSSPESSLRWSKIQLMDFVQSLVNTEFGVLFHVLLAHFNKLRTSLPIYIY